MTSTKIEELIRRLSDDTVKGLLRSIGDAGANPQNQTGYTVLKLLYTIYIATLNTQNCLLYPTGSETFTTTPLGANAVYYSPSRDYLQSRLSAFGIMGYADQPSATDGVQIQLSLDNTNWDYIGAKASLAAAGAVSLAQIVTCRYARAVWANGATAQTVFRFGGRYFISGSENPTLTLNKAKDPEPICKICGKDMTETSDFFFENGIVYCPKCYAIKRFKELDVKARNEWIKQLKVWVKKISDAEKDRVKLHIPDAILDVVWVK